MSFLKWKTSTIKSLNELIMKAISAIHKSQKRPSKTRIYQSIKIFLKSVTLMMVYFGKEWSTLKRMKIFLINLQKNGNSFYISKSDWKTVSSPIDQTSLINSPRNSVLIPQDLQDNLSIIKNSTDKLSSPMWPFGT